MIHTVAWMLCAVSLVTAPGGVFAQPDYDEVVGNLRNVDAKVRLNALRLLREARHVAAIEAIAPLVVDPVDDIQLEAIATELAFYLVDEIPNPKRVAFLFEIGGQGNAANAFALGPLAVWPRPVPAELVANLLKAAGDDNSRVRIEALYALGVIARPPLATDHADALMKVLEHPDPAVRVAAADVAGRLQVKAAGDTLIKLIDDPKEEVRFAAMRALGAIGEERAAETLSDQLMYYERGDGAWSALHGLAQIGHKSSIPVFKAHLDNRDPRLRRAAAEGLGRANAIEESETLLTTAGGDSEASVRAAAAYALLLQGSPYVPRLAEMLLNESVALQVREYLRLLGPGIEQALLPSLLDYDPILRSRVARVAGAIGGDAARTALTPLVNDKDKRVAQEAAWALERIEMRAAGPR